MKTTLAKKTNKSEQKWYVVDAKNQVLGRLAVKLANMLRGRNKPTYTPHTDTGDYVIVINAKDVKVTGKKRQNKEYMTYSGYVSGEKYYTFEDLINRKPDYIITEAVKGMMPKNKLCHHQMMTKLRVFGGSDYSEYAAQNPTPVNI